jgi:hypothetical protein
MSGSTPPSIKLNGATEPTTMATQPPAPQADQYDALGTARPAPARADTTFSRFSTMSVPPEGSILTGKQEHCAHGSSSKHSNPY